MTILVKGPTTPVVPALTAVNENAKDEAKPIEAAATPVPEETGTEKHEPQNPTFGHSQAQSGQVWI